MARAVGANSIGVAGAQAGGRPGVGVLAVLALQIITPGHWRARAASQPAERLNIPFVVTQLPGPATAEQAGRPVSRGMLRAQIGDGARLVVVGADKAVAVLTADLHSACDPDVSFDATRLLFAGKRRPSDDWNIFEMRISYLVSRISLHASRDALHASRITRQVTKDLGDCRSPGYQGTLYTIISPKPWRRLTFVRSEPGVLNEYGEQISTNLYSCRLDGSAVRGLTFNLSSDMDPFIMPDGRLLFASWQRARLDDGLLGSVKLFAANTDGADFALFAGDQDTKKAPDPFSRERGKPIRHMPCVTTKGLVVFVEADRVGWDGAGTLGSVRLRRPLHSYRPVTRPADGLFHSPSPLPDGRVLVSHRSADGRDTHGVVVLDPDSGSFQPVFDDPNYHDIQAKAIVARSEPDGRSSVVTEKDPYGKFYCLNVYINDLQPAWLPEGTVKRLRVLEGIPLKSDDLGATSGGQGPRATGIAPMAQRRILGEIPVAEDGSFNIEIPANLPIELQTLDENGMALRSCGWIWAKNHEPRGCVGCHEDGELTPENRMAQAVTRPSIKLTLPAERRRTVDFRRDVMPIIANKCAACHASNTAMRLTPDLSPVRRPDGKAYFNRSYESLLKGAESGYGKYVHPGRARTSPLIWNLFGRDTSRPWDRTVADKPARAMPPAGARPLTAEEKRTFVEWIDMGALWDGIPGPDDLPNSRSKPGARQR